VSGSCDGRMRLGMRRSAGGATSSGQTYRACKQRPDRGAAKPSDFRSHLASHLNLSGVTRSATMKIGCKRYSRRRRPAARSKRRSFPVAFGRKPARTSDAPRGPGRAASVRHRSRRSPHER
jgi:hypothetical protein